MGELENKKGVPMKTVLLGMILTAMVFTSVVWSHQSYQMHILEQRLEQRLDALKEKIIFLTQTLENVNETYLQDLSSLEYYKNKLIEVDALYEESKSQISELEEKVLSLEKRLGQKTKTIETTISIIESLETTMADIFTYQPSHTNILELLGRLTMTLEHKIILARAIDRLSQVLWVYETSNYSGEVFTKLEDYNITHRYGTGSFIKFYFRQLKDTNHYKRFLVVLIGGPIKVWQKGDFVAYAAGYDDHDHYYEIMMQKVEAEIIREYGMTIDQFQKNTSDLGMTAAGKMSKYGQEMWYQSGINLLSYTHVPLEEILSSLVIDGAYTLVG